MLYFNKLIQGTSQKRIKRFSFFFPFHTDMSIFLVAANMIILFTVLLGFECSDEKLKTLSIKPGNNVSSNSSTLQ